jgi:hypothetical protein
VATDPSAMQPSPPSGWLHGFRARVAQPSILSAVGLSAVFLLYTLLKLYSLNFVNGDEHMYFYMSLLVSKGKWPYRDFFFSHPPLQLYIMGALYKAFGYSLALSKAVPSVAAMVSGVHVYLIGKRLVGRLEGVLGTALFLFTFDVLRGSSHFTGANCALAFGSWRPTRPWWAARFSPGPLRYRARSSACTWLPLLSCWPFCSPCARGRNRCASWPATPPGAPSSASVRLGGGRACLLVPRSSATTSTRSPSAIPGSQNSGTSPT